MQLHAIDIDVEIKTALHSNTWSCCISIHLAITIDLDIFMCNWERSIVNCTRRTFLHNCTLPAEMLKHAAQLLNHH
jgi:hypothetical protein